MSCEKTYDDYFTPDGSPREDAAEEFHADNFTEAVSCAHKRGSKSYEDIANTAIFQVWCAMSNTDRCDRIDAKGNQETPKKRVLAIVRNLAADEAKQSGRDLRAAAGLLESESAQWTPKRAQRHQAWIERSTRPAPSAHDVIERRERAERQVCGFYDGIRQMVCYAEAVQSNPKLASAALRKRVMFEMASRGQDPTPFYERIAAKGVQWKDSERVHKQLSAASWSMVDPHNTYLHTWRMRKGTELHRVGADSYDPTPIAREWGRQFLAHLDKHCESDIASESFATNEIYYWVVTETDAFTPSERRRLEYRTMPPLERERCWDVEYYYKRLG